jgi:hypothetical protein
MPDPTGSQGIVPRPPPTDVDLAMDGGPSLIERMDALSKAKQAADRALADLKLGQAAKSALEKAEQMKAAAEDAYVKAGHDLADATRKVEEARAQAKAIMADADKRSKATIADADKRSADADQRLAAAEKAEQDVMKERAIVRAAEKAAAAVKKDFETRLARLQAGLDELLAEDAT